MRSSLVFADHVTLNFARSGGPGGQNVNKGVTFLFASIALLCIVDFDYLMNQSFTCVTNSLFSFCVTVNTKVDMRFSVKNAYWLSDRIREKIIQTVCFCTSLLPCTRFCWGIRSVCSVLAMRRVF